MRGATVGTLRNLALTGIGDHCAMGVATSSARAGAPNETLFRATARRRVHCSFGGARIGHVGPPECGVGPTRSHCSLSADAPLGIDAARRDLLELSTRNRLLATPRDQDRGLSLEIKDELSDEIFRMMVTEAKPMRFEQGVVVAQAPTAQSLTDIGRQCYSWRHGSSCTRQLDRLASEAYGALADEFPGFAIQEINDLPTRRLEALTTDNRTIVGEPVDRDLAGDVGGALKQEPARERQADDEVDDERALVEGGREEVVGPREPRAEPDAEVHAGACPFCGALASGKTTSRSQTRPSTTQSAISGTSASVTAP